MKNLIVVLVYADTELPELFLTLVSISWGLWNLSPMIDPSLGLNGQLSAIAPVSVWAWAFVIGGVLGFMGLIFNVNWIRRAATLLLAFLWLNVSLASFLVRGAGALAFFVIALERAWIFLRLTSGFNEWLQSRWHS